MDVGSAIIEVVIGLVFVYSLLSLLVTQVNTVIVNLLNIRARHLKGGLEKMITDPVVRAKVMAHPLIRLIEPPVVPEERMTAQTAEQAVTEGKVTKVSFVAPKTFVDVLTDVLGSDAGRKLYAALYKATEPLPTSTEKSLLREQIRRFQLTGQGLDELRASINQLSNQQVKQELLQALEWFDATMEKLQIENGELIPLLTAWNVLLGTGHADLYRTDTDWFQIDDDFYRVTGFCHVIANMIPAVEQEYRVELDSRAGLRTLFREILPPLARCAVIKPIYVFNGRDSGVLANSRRNLDAYVNEARQKIYSIRDELEK